MGRKVNPNVTARDKEIVDELMAGKSRAELMRKYGVSASTIERAKRKFGGALSPNIKAGLRKPYVAREKLSDRHKRLGMTVKLLREYLGMPQMQLADTLPLSGWKVSELENALYSPTLEEMERCAEFFGLSVPELLEANRPGYGVDQQTYLKVRNHRQAQENKLTC